MVFEERGTLTHGMDGFRLTGSYENEPYDISWSVPLMHACHIEYDYMRRGDCIDLNTNDDTLYLFPEKGDFAITKISIATEELFKHHA